MPKIYHPGREAPMGRRGVVGRYDDRPKHPTVTMPKKGATIKIQRPRTRRAKKIGA